MPTLSLFTPRPLDFSPLNLVFLGLDSQIWPGSLDDHFDSNILSCGLFGDLWITSEVVGGWVYRSWHDR